MLKNLSLIFVILLLLSITACNVSTQSKQNDQDDTNTAVTGPYVLSNSTVSVSSAVVASGERIEVKLVTKDEKSQSFF